MPAPPPSRAEPLGVVLAGGAGRRLGGSKALARLGGRPLISYPLAALQTVLAEVVVVAKAATTLPDLGDVPVWIEPDEPRHPVAGIVHALRRAGGREVLVCAADMPWVTPGLVRRIKETDGRGGAVVLFGHSGGLEPLLARYPPAVLAPLARAGTGALRAAVATLDPLVLELADPAPLASVNTRAELAAAQADLRA